MSGSGDYQSLNDCFDVDDNSVGILIVVSILLMIFIIYQRTTLKAFSSKQLTIKRQGRVLKIVFKLILIL